MKDVHIRVGTWNVQYATPDRNSARLQRLIAEYCDVIVLTETHSDLALPDPYKPVAMGQRPGARLGGSWVTIWTRREVTGRFESAPDLRAIAVELEDSVVVYGTVLPWDSESLPDTPADARAKSWAEFLRLLPQHERRWEELRAAHPDHLLVVAGDLNQSLGHGDGYGSKDARAALRRSLTAAGLTCFTDGDRFEADLAEDPIDHICAAPPSGATLHASNWKAWEGRSLDGAKLSDHSGVAVTIST
ncbi:endonuclease/exonuclease/phosphatase family protein [Geodermatophilus sp. FMUSA9-8]|uniref:endonuclease/exonuclease/phosphatase family protein n=1 Tax=Geodermatophilus sp. FMUSA9-8 TaxID=3120155 RepID=UPI003009BC49